MTSNRSGVQHVTVSGRRLYRAWKLGYERLAVYLRTRRDRPRVERLIPGLLRTVGGEAPTATDLESAYADYVSNVSDPQMPISLDLARFMRSLCLAVHPGSILDLGSGFSSYVFRRYALGAEVSPNVLSVDDDAGWLEKTGGFLDSAGLSSSGLATWDEFKAGEGGSYDLILYDLDGFDLRIQVFEEVAALLRPGGLMIIDDAHVYVYRRELLRKLRGMKFVNAYSLRAFTLDPTGRYAMLLHNVPRSEPDLSRPARRSMGGVREER